MIKKEIRATSNSWLEAIRLVKIFIDVNSLELEKLDLKKEGEGYIVSIEYNLGIKR